MNPFKCEDYMYESFIQVVDQNDDPAAVPNKLVHKKDKWLLGHPRSFRGGPDNWGHGGGGGWENEGRGWGNENGREARRERPNLHLEYKSEGL